MAHNFPAYKCGFGNWHGQHDECECVPKVIHDPDNPYRVDAGSDDVREAAYRLCDAMKAPPPWLPSANELREFLRRAYVHRAELNSRIAQAERALGMAASQQ